MKIARDATIVRSKVPVETTVGSEVVLMSLASGECFGLGETGSEVWRLLASPTRIEPVVERLRQAYDAPEGEIEGDILELLERMLAMHLIEIVPAAS